MALLNFIGPNGLNYDCERSHFTGVVTLNNMNHRFTDTSFAVCIISASCDVVITQSGHYEGWLQSMVLFPRAWDEMTAECGQEAPSVFVCMSNVEHK